MKVIGENFVIIPEKHEDILYHKLIFGDEENIKLLFKKMKINKPKNGFMEIKFKGLGEAELRVNKDVGIRIQEEYKNLIENEPVEEYNTHTLDEFMEAIRYANQRPPRFHPFTTERYFRRYVTPKDRIIAYIKKYWLSILIGYFVGLIITVLIL